jgi:hypothetical protein
MVLGRAGIITLVTACLTGVAACLAPAVYRAAASRRVVTTMYRQRSVGQALEASPTLRACLAKFAGPLPLEKVRRSCGAGEKSDLVRDGWGNQLELRSERNWLYIVSPGRDGRTSRPLPTQYEPSCGWDDEVIYRVSVTGERAEFLKYPVDLPLHFPGELRPSATYRYWSFKSR